MVRRRSKGWTNKGSWENSMVTYGVGVLGTYWSLGVEIKRSG